MNAHLAETVACLPAFPCEGMTVKVVLCHVLRAPPGRGYGSHRHGHLELSFVTEGCVYYATENEEIPVPEGHVFLMPAGVPHQWTTHDVASVIFGFMLEVADAEREAVLHGLEDMAHGLHHRMSMVSQVAGCQALLAKQVADRSFRPDLGAPLMRALLAATFRQFMTDRQETGTPPDAGIRQWKIFEKARIFIEANADHSLSADEIADFAGVSSRHLNRIFRTHDGRSVTAFAHERRLERVRAMLAEGHGAKETAYTCGFRDPAYFTRFFKRYSGMTPSAYSQAVQHRR